MNKAQKEMIVKGFRLLRVGAAEAERIALKGDPSEIAEQMTGMQNLLGEMQKALGYSVAAQNVLENIQGKAKKAPVGRPRTKLRLVR